MSKINVNILKYFSILLWVFLGGENSYNFCFSGVMLKCFSGFSAAEKPQENVYIK